MDLSALSDRMGVVGCEVQLSATGGNGTCGRAVRLDTRQPVYVRHNGALSRPSVLHDVSEWWGIHYLALRERDRLRQQPATNQRC